MKSTITHEWQVLCFEERMFANRFIRETSKTPLLSRAINRAVGRFCQQAPPATADELLALREQSANLDHVIATIGHMSHLAKDQSDCVPSLSPIATRLSNSPFDDQTLKRCDDAIDQTREIVETQ